MTTVMNLKLFLVLLARRLSSTLLIMTVMSTLLIFVQEVP